MAAICPECAETKLNPIHATLIDTLLEFMGVHHFRCTFCRRNIYTSATLAHPEQHSSHLHHA